MKTVRDIQTKREKELRILIAKEDKEISLANTIEKRFNDLDSKLTRLLRILEATGK